MKVKGTFKIDEKKKWYERAWAVRLLLIIFYPVGLYGFIRGTKKPIIIIIITTLINVGFWTLIIITPASDPEIKVTNTTEVKENDNEKEQIITELISFPISEQNKNNTVVTWYTPAVDDISELTKLAGKWSSHKRLPLNYSYGGMSFTTYIDFNIIAQFSKTFKTENDRIVNIEISMNYDELLDQYAKEASKFTNRTKKQIEADKNEVWELLKEMNPEEQVINDHGSLIYVINKHSFIMTFSMDAYMFANYFYSTLLEGNFLVNSQNNKIRTILVGLGDINSGSPLEIELIKK